MCLMLATLCVQSAQSVSPKCRIANVFHLVSAKRSQPLFEFFLVLELVFNLCRAGG